MIACPRHGRLSVAKDAPCPDCGVAAYDLDDRLARDVVRQNRELGLKTRKTVCGVALFVVGCFGAGTAFAFDQGGFQLNVVPLFVGAILAAFGSRPLALQLERNPALHALDGELARLKV